MRERVSSQSRKRSQICHRRTFDRDTLSIPVASLPTLPYDDESWTVAYISRNKSSGELQFSLSSKPLAGVQNVWHHVRVDGLEMEKLKSLTGSTFEAVVHKPSIPSLQPCSTVIAKIARFEWEIPRIERETRAYQLLEKLDLKIAPRFLGHIAEGRRVIGILLEKLVDTRSASIEDLADCERVLGNFHSHGLLHGDVNRYNFLVGKGGGVKIIDFERFQENSPKDMKRKEMQSVREELVDQSGRVAGFVFSEDDE